MQVGTGYFRVGVLEVRASTSSAVRQTPEIWTRVERGRVVTIGTRSELTVGVSPRDPGVSRVAAKVTVGDRGWLIDLTNRNGQVLHRWCSHPEWFPAGTFREVRWPRVAIRIAGLDDQAQHWILLESDEFAIDTPALVRTPTYNETMTREQPKDLTPLQRAAVETVFEAYLAWPPAAQPSPRPLSASRLRLGHISESAVRERLAAARARAYKLGLAERVDLSDPTFVYRLAEHGYFAPPPMTDI